MAGKLEFVVISQVGHIYFRATRRRFLTLFSSNSISPRLKLDM